MTNKPEPPLNPQDVWIVRPGDYVALIHKEPMSDLEREIAKTVLEERWPDVHCVLFEGDWDIKIMRSDDNPPPDPRRPECRDGTAAR